MKRTFGWPWLSAFFIVSTLAAHQSTLAVAESTGEVFVPACPIASAPFQSGIATGIGLFLSLTPINSGAGLVLKMKLV